MSSAEEFVKSFEMRKPVFAKEVRGTLERHPRLFVEIAEPMLEWARVALGPQYVDRLISGYCELVIDVNRCQVEYEKSGRYRHSSYREVHDATYASREFMESYHWGVYTSMFAWQHHLELCAFYRDAFVSRIGSESASGTIVDLGCGSGLWHLMALHRLPGWSAFGVDISETSLETTRAMTREVMPERGIRYELADAITWAAPVEFEAGVSSFLLEHLEDPAGLLQNLCRAIQPGALAYVSCGLTAAQCDHIYVFERESEVVSMAEEAGFRVVQTFSAAPSRVLPNRRYLPRSMGLVLQRRRTALW